MRRLIDDHYTKKKFHFLIYHTLEFNRKAVSMRLVIKNIKKRNKYLCVTNLLSYFSINIYVLQTYLVTFLCKYILN